MSKHNIYNMKQDCLTKFVLHKFCVKCLVNLINYTNSYPAETPEWI